MPIFYSLALFALTAVAEIVGCYLPYLWLKKSGSPWLILPSLLSLCLFVWLLTLHPAASGRVYAAYGGVYVSVAFLWLCFVDGIHPAWPDLLGLGFILIGVLVIVLNAWQR